MKECRHIALLLAGGKGSRMNTSLPKQYIRVDGESILVHTMRAFDRHPLISDIYVVCAKEWEAEVMQEAESCGIGKFRQTIRGGNSAFQSLQNGIRFLSRKITEKETVVLVHDAVRPLVTQDIISRNIAVCLTHGNAITALSSNEAFALSRDGQSTNGYLPREGVLRAQTPHTFTLTDLEDILQMAESKGITDSQSLFTLANELGIQPLYTAQGDLLNFKITSPSDILIYKALKTLED